jgi:SecA DEAD-like domain
MTRSVLFAHAAVALAAIARVACFQPRTFSLPSPSLLVNTGNCAVEPSLNFASRGGAAGYGLPIRPLSDTRLRMGIMEDFLAGSDKSKRDADNAQYLATLQQRVDRINAMESTIEDLGDDELEAKTREFQRRLQNGEDINGPLLEEAFAVVREAAWYVSWTRALESHNQHYTVQANKILPLPVNAFTLKRKASIGVAAL